MSEKTCVLSVVIWILLGALPHPLRAATPEAAVMVMTLDSISHVSFDDELILPIGAGRTIRFLTYAHEGRNAVSLRVDPSGIGSSKLSLGRDKGDLTAELVEEGKGFLRAAGDGGLVMELDIVIRVTSSTSSEVAVREFPLHLTTEPVEGWNAEGTKRFNLAGTRVASATRIVQLVGKSTAGKDGGPVPGAAIYVVLSGVLDTIPTLAPATD